MIIVAGTARVPTENMKLWREGAAAVIAATRKEAGCRIYSFAEDVLEPGLIRMFEVWETRDHLQAHSRAPHLTAWRQVLAEVKAYDRNLMTYEAGEGTPL